MKKMCFTMFALLCFVILGCAIWSFSKNATEDESEVFDLTENAKMEENSAQEDASTDEMLEVFFEKKLQETDNPRISELLNISGTHFDGYNQDSYHYQIPQFNAESESAKAVNQRIDEQLSEIIEQEFVNISEGCSLITHSVTYEIFEYGDVTAIVVTVPYPNDCKDYFAYTFDFQKDEELTNIELLAMNGMTEEDFVTEICRLQEADFFKLAQSGANPMTDQEMINDYITNVNSYATVDLPMYFDSNGILQAYIPFASIAGADWYYQLRQF